MRNNDDIMIYDDNDLTIDDIWYYFIIVISIYIYINNNKIDTSILMISGIFYVNYIQYKVVPQFVS